MRFKNILKTRPINAVLGCIVLVLFTFNAKAQQDVENFWAKRLGSNGFDQCSKIALEGSGNVVVLGNFEGQVDFDPGPGTTNLTSSGESDIYFSKYDSLGNFLWAKKIGGTGSDSGLDLLVDGMGNIYLTGYFSGTADFNPGSGVSNLISAGSLDIFLAKYDINGNYIWAESIGGTSVEMATKMALGADGDLYFTGFFSGSVDFNSGSGSLILQASGMAPDIFIAKYSNNGLFMWAKQMGGGGMDQGRGIALDQNDNVYVTGIFISNVDFDPSSGTAILSSSNLSTDIFIAKYDSQGNYVWAHKIGGTSLDYGTDIHIDKNNDILITGYFSRSADFDPDTTDYILTPEGSYSTFLAKYDVQGNFIWAKNLNGSVSNGMSVTSDLSGNIYLIGSFTDSVRINPDTLVSPFISAGFGDVFFCKFDSGGNFLWANQIGGTGRDEGLHIIADPGEQVYLVGSFENNTEFYSSSGSTILNSAGNTDGFIAKYQKISTVGMNKMEWTEPVPFRIYPNPSSQVFTIAADAISSDLVNITARSITGKLIFSKSLEMKSNGVTLNVENWAKGVYIITISDKYRIAHQRVVVN